MTQPLALTEAERQRVVLVRQGRWLITRFTTTQQVLSWAIVGGGRRTTRTVAWYQVRERELRPPVEARRFLRERLAEAALGDAVGLLTSSALDAYIDVERRHGALAVRCIATVGLGNALRAGDPPGPTARIGTINLLCCVSESLTEEALVEGLALAAEARTAEVLEASVLSRLTGQPATGTGTDCIVIAAPATEGPARYVGKHTVLGYLIGAVVGEATRRGVEAWRRSGTS
jgi:adenosylcobinamide amidohydrolase